VKGLEVDTGTYKWTLPSIGQLTEPRSIKSLRSSPVLIIPFELGEWARRAKSCPSIQPSATLRRVSSVLAEVLTMINNLRHRGDLFDVECKLVIRRFNISL